ncbi:hypothetical protein D3C73_1543300 [compost metagenome]
MIAIERRQIVPMTATKAGIFFKQPFLQIEAEVASFIVKLIRRDLRQRVFINLTVGKQHVIQRFTAIFRFLCQ